MNHTVVGILTLQNSNNYGAMYQAYALSKFLEKNGFEVFIIDYEMTRDNSSILDYIKKPIAFIQKLIYKKELILNKLKNIKKPEAGVDSHREFCNIFNGFRNDYLKITNTKYNYHSLLANCPVADAYICGSDQVWAADFLFTSPAFLLGFVPENKKKISYAASFGKSKLEPYLDKTFTNYINKFEAISVREKSGVEIVKNVSGLDVAHVLDPTLLLDKNDYATIIDYSLVPEEPYVFVYKLNQERKLSNWMDNCINEINQKNQLPVLAVSTNLVHPFDEKWHEIRPTPGQLLGLIEKSSMNFTNSFHGTVFAILFKTKFLSFARDKHQDKQNVRLTDLLTSLDMLETYCPPFEASEKIALKLNQPHNLETVFGNLNRLKQKSSMFLSDVLTK